MLVTKVDVNGLVYALRLNPDQLAARSPGDLITAEIVDVAPGVETSENQPPSHYV
jgi:hypothetical protein